MSDNLTDAVVVFTLRLRKPGATGKVNVADVTVKAKHVDASASKDAEEDSLKVSKTIIKNPIYKEIGALDGALRAYLRSQALPTRLAGGSYLVPVSLVEKIDAHVSKRATERTALVESLSAVYPEIIADARERLGDLFNEGDFPGPAAFREAFDLETSIAALADPGSSLSKFSAALYERESRKAETARVAMVSEIRDGMRLAMFELVSSLTTQLTPSEDGTRRKIMGGAFANIRTFIDEFQARNVSNDGELASLVARARDLLAGVRVDAVRASGTVKAELQRSLSSLGSTLGSLTTSDGAAVRFSFIDDMGDAGTVQVAPTSEKMSERIGNVDVNEGNAGDARDGTNQASAESLQMRLAGIDAGETDIAAVKAGANQDSADRIATRLAGVE